MKSFKQLDDIFDRPSDRGGSMATPDEVQDRLTDNTAVEAYKLPWPPQGHHLGDATEDFVDAVWAVTEGRRDVRQLSSVPEIGKGKK